MGEFTRTALGFPTALFTFALLVVAGYWLLALLLGAGLDGGDGHLDGHGGHGGDGTDASVPVTALVSVGIAVAWFVSLTGQVLLGGRWAGFAVLAAAATTGWLAARAAGSLGRRLLPPERHTSRDALVGRTCVVRTGRVDPSFGQAEVTGDDGTTFVVQVRTDESGLTAGCTALIFDHDADGDFFRVMRCDAALGPERPAS